MKNINSYLTIAVVISILFGATTPALAFSFQWPEQIKNLISQLQTKLVAAQEQAGDILFPAPTETNSLPDGGTMSTPPPTGDFQPPPPTGDFRPPTETDNFNQKPMMNPDGQFDESRQAEDDTRQKMDSERRMKDMKRGVTGMEKMVKAFEKQLNKLAKQKITMPATVTENLTKIKEAIAGIKNASDPEQAEDLMQELPDLMNNLNETRQELEMLARWPQTLKQVDRQLNQLKKTLKKSKTTVDKLATKGIDLSSVYDKFSEDVAKLETARNAAVAAVQAGNATDGFEVLENDFFTELEDVGQNQQTIMMMTNLSRLPSELKRAVKQTEREIAKLKKQKEDTVELESMLAELKSKQAEITGLLAQKPVDPEAIKDVLLELQEIRAQFEDRIDADHGENEQMPWEGGKQQFNQLSVPTQFNQFIHPNAGAPAGQE
ncbi:MAG: hypothetical protein Q7S66_01840 [bacterium]|nr:hypothetical protein [bacterium]